MKHQIVHALQKYVLNPPIELLFAMGVAPPGYALLETIGQHAKAFEDSVFLGFTKANR